MSPIKKIVNLYNPANLTKEELKESFVVRGGIFRKMLDAIKDAPMSAPEQHYLVQGPRGTGKTTLLLRLKYAVLEDEELSRKVIPIAFNEEQYGIRSLFRLWDAVADYLEEESPGEFDGLYKQVEDLEDDADQCFETLFNALQKRKKKLLLLIDNIGDLFNRFTKKEMQRLREILITSKDIIIVGASSVILEHTYSYDKPFFDFFKIIHLKGLDGNETETLLLHLGEEYETSEVKEIVKKQKGRVEALRRLTGGIPRTIILLFEIFLDDEDGNSFKDLEAILDRVTPLYKHRMDDLSPQQQDIVNTIAMHWDAVSTKEIAKDVRMESKAVSAQLRQLEKNRIIHKIKTSTKNHLYQITERFFNIWYLMRHGRSGDKKKVLWLVRFLESWCSEEDLIRRTQTLIGSLKRDDYNPHHAYFLTEALARTALPMDHQHHLIRATRNFLETTDKQLLKNLSKSDKELYNESELIFKRKQYVDCVNNLLEMNNKHIGVYINIARCYYNMGESSNTERYYLLAVEEENADAMFSLALLYETEFKDIDRAEKYYLMAIEKEHANAMFNLASLYETEFEDTNRAEKYYLMAIEKEHAIAMNNLANLYRAEFKDMDRAEKYYLMAIEKEHAIAMNNLASLYETEFKDMDRAEKYYLMAVDNNNANAMNNIANLYRTEFKDIDRAKKYYLMAIEKEHATAMNNLASLYETEFKDMDRAEKYYLMAVDNNDANAMNNIANLYRTEFKDIDRAEKYYLMAVDNHNDRAMNDLAWLYFTLKMKRKECLALARQSVDVKASLVNRHTLSCALLWNNQIEASITFFEKIIHQRETIEKHYEDIQLSLIFFIGKKQYHYVLNLFKNDLLKLKDRFKPLYYALMTLMQDEYPDEIKKMGVELKETVEEVLATIEKMARDYE